MTTAFSQIMATIDRMADLPLIESRGTWLTGAEFKARIAMRRDDLRRAGVRQKKVALIVVSDNLCAIEQLIACWWLGAAGCLVDFRTPPGRMAEWRAQLNPSLIVGLRPVPGLPVHVQPRTPVETREVETRDVELRDVDADRDTSETVCDPAWLACIFSSSGTTSRPQLNFTQQAQLLASLEARLREMDLTVKGATLSAISVAYSAMSSLWLTNLLIGRRIVAMDLIYRIEDLDSALKRADVAECSLPPSEIRRLLSVSSDTTPRYPNITRLTSVGGPASPDDKVAAARRLTPHYVMTYSCVGVGVIARIEGSEVLERPASCGMPKPPVHVEIRQGDRPCLPGEEGEIIVSTDRVKNRRPGDVGYLDEAGYLYVTGRVQGLLCRNSVNFSAQRLINASLALAEVGEAAVVATANDDGGDKVHLVVQLAPEWEPKLRDHLRRTLPATEQPDLVHLHADMPITSAGKVDLRAVKAWVLEKMDG